MRAVLDTKPENSELRRRMPDALVWVRDSLGCSWSGLARELGMEYHHLCEVRRGMRTLTPSQQLALYILAERSGVFGQLSEFLLGCDNELENELGPASSSLSSRLRGGSQISAARRRRTAGRP